MPVTIIVIGDLALATEQRPYQDRPKKASLGRLTRGAHRVFYPQTEGGNVHASMHVYARRTVASLSVAAPAIRLDPLKALIIRKELR